MTDNTERNKQIIAAYNQGVGLLQICEKERCSRATIYRVLKDAGINSNRTQKVTKDDLVECQNCFAKMPKGAKFCMECGAKLMTRRRVLLNNVSFIRAKSLQIDSEDAERFIDYCNALYAYLLEQPDI